MLNVQGKARLMNLKKVTDKMVVGDIYTVRTVNDKLQSSFFKCKIVGKALETLKADKIGNKQTIEVVNGMLEIEQTELNGKKYNNPTITLFEITKGETTFKQVDDEEIPF